MATDVVLVEQSVEVFLEPQEKRTLVQFAPIPTGRSYVITATGFAQGRDTRAILTLEAFDAKDSLRLGFENNDHWQVSFSLVVGVWVPPDEDLFTVAKVTAEKHGDGFAGFDNIKLVVLPVDSVTVIPFSR